MCLFFSDKCGTVEPRLSAPANKACPPKRLLTYSPMRDFVVNSMLAIRQLHYMV